MKLTFDHNGFSKQVRMERLIIRNIDMRTMAKDLDISISTISRAENGKAPDLLTYAKLCTWMRKPMTEFIKKKGK